MPLLGEYIYGIVEEAQYLKFNFPGIGSADVYTINHERMAAVVSDTELPEIDPTRKNVRAHTVVQEALLKEYNLLPMGFGMVATDRGEVRRLLEDNYDGLLGELHRLAGKIEVELKVFWEQEAVVKELQGENAELSRLKAKINTASSPVEVQNLLSTAGKLVESIVRHWKTRYAELVYAILQELSCEAKMNNPVGIKNLLNASFLIEKSRECEFKEQVYKLDAGFQGKMNFKYVGPLPPYNFVSLKLEPVKC
ncbi:MAG: GvpL/GvpF family gas vesicle protein [Chloroflexi bacterium]|nr:GvpL/GvpF family gas vesicle protein [Chloroflexota bacterium]